MVIEHWLQIARSHENGTVGRRETGYRIEDRAGRRRASFALGVIGIISIDPDSLPRFYHLAHRLPGAGWVIGSFDLTGEKTHGNSAGHGHAEWHSDREMRVADLGRIKGDVRDVYY